MSRQRSEHMELMRLKGVVKDGHEKLDEMRDV
jgi:hypothetical protein